jgi:hypothetical protein
MHMYIIIFIFDDINQLIQNLTFSSYDICNRIELIGKIMTIYNHILVVFFFGRRRNESFDMSTNGKKMQLLDDIYTFF